MYFYICVGSILFYISVLFTNTKAHFLNDRIVGVATALVSQVSTKPVQSVSWSVADQSLSWSVLVAGYNNLRGDAAEVLRSSRR